MGLVLRGFQRKRANDIVCLHPIFHQQGQPHGTDNLMDRFNLLSQLIGHRWAV